MHWQVRSAQYSLTVRSSAAWLTRVALSARNCPSRTWNCAVFSLRGITKSSTRTTPLVPATCEQHRIHHACLHIVQILLGSYTLSPYHTLIPATQHKENVVITLQRGIAINCSSSHGAEVTLSCTYRVPLILAASNQLSEQCISVNGSKSPSV